MRALKNRAGRWLVLVVAAMCGALAMAIYSSSHAEARSPLGSSCAHPYKVHMLVGTRGHGTPIPGKTPGEMLGNTRLIKASYRELGHIAVAGHPVVPSLAWLGFTWKPAVGGLHLCRARIQFSYRRSLVSHQWHRHQLKVPINPEVQPEERVTSFVVMAAR